MECKKCNYNMVKRANKAPKVNVEVYVCPKCGTLLFVYAEGDEKWEP